MTLLFLVSHLFTFSFHFLSLLIYWDLQYHVEYEGDSEHNCLFPDLREKVFNNLPLGIMLLIDVL